MCGIAALFSTAPAPLHDSIVRMTAAVRHRGPDDEGYAVFGGRSPEMHAWGGADTPDQVYRSRFAYTPTAGAPQAGDAQVAVGHRRLSIVDLTAAGHQPMCTADRRYWIVFNGEIYNYIELREELARLGHAFVTHCDTEVILAAYREWGRACLDRFNGMFAFVLVDREARRLFVARDRFGVKPLYYWRSSDGLVAFASEIKQLTVLPSWRARANAQRCYDFLNWNLIDHTGETLFDGVRQIRNGEALELGYGPDAPPLAPGATLPVFRWYDPRPLPFAGDFAEAAQRFREVLTDSVALRLRADVPVGSCLSGGLDSSAIVCVLNALLESRGAHDLQKTFSACVEARQLDERPYMEDVVRATGADAHYVYPQPGELFDELDELTWHQDEPFASTSIYAQWHVFRLARANAVKVMLDGQGADETLGGYNAYFGPHLASLLLGGRLRSLAREMRALRSVHGRGALWGLQRIADVLLPEAIRQPLRARSGRAGTSGELVDVARLGAEPRDPYLAAGGAKCRSIAELSHAQLTHTHLQMLLHWEDRDSMAHSVEARVPFLDYRLVELALGLPADYKIEGGITKQVLREAMRGVLPESVRLRTDKLGFVTPEALWATGDHAAAFRKRLAEAIEVSRGIVAGRALTRFDAMVAGQAPYDFGIWRAISFGRWLSRFGVEV